LEGVSLRVGVIESVGVMLTPAVVETDILGDRVSLKVKVSDTLAEKLILGVSEIVAVTLIEGDSEFVVVSLIVADPDMLTDALGV